MTKDINMTILNDYYGSFLTEKQSDVFDLFYNEDLSLSEIGDHLGITRQGVRDSLKRGEATLLEMEANIGLAKKRENLSKAITTIQAMTNELNLLVQSSGSLSLINKMNEMKKTLEGVMDGI